jgi:spore coat protein U-like protein
MRNILLAGAAMLATTGLAMAVVAPTSQNVGITASLAELCTITDPNDVAVPGTTSGSTSPAANFTFACNFAGAGAAPVLQIAFSSANGGLTSGSETVDYNINYGAAIISSATAFVAPVQVAETTSGANATNNRSFTVSLAEDITVAGSYSDTVTVSISF